MSASARLLTLFCFCAATGAPMLAAAQTAPVATVQVTTTRDPVDKSYRAMLKGMDLFARAHAYAPQATLRFQLLPRDPALSMDGITLRVAGDTLSLPLRVDARHSFVLPRNDLASREDAAVLANRHTSSLTWRALIETPGLPAGTRRLGDLRLECRVGVEAGLISNSSPLFGWIDQALNSAEQVCTSPKGNYLFFSDRPIFSVTLRSGTRSETLPFSMLYAGGTQTPASLRYCDCQAMLDRTYYAPIWDRSWPDDTLVAFTYMQEAAAENTP